MDPIERFPQNCIQIREIYAHVLAKEIDPWEDWVLQAVASVKQQAETYKLTERDFARLILDPSFYFLSQKSRKAKNA